VNDWRFAMIEIRAHALDVLLAEDACRSGAVLQPTGPLLDGTV
jgi:hypothetical protein